MNTLFIAYHAASNPIMESQGFPYMRGLSREGIRYSLLTFEPKEKLADSIKLISELDMPLRWKHLAYHNKPRHLATFYDIAFGILIVAFIIKKDKIKLLHARGFIAALIAFLPAKIFRIKILFDTRGLLADKYVCGGLLDKKGLTYKVMRLCEDMLIRRSDSFTIETNRHAKAIIDSQDFGTLNDTNGVLSKMNVIPCCVDTDKFDYRLYAPRAENKFNLVFLGKIETWYLIDKMLDFFVVASKEIIPLKFTFITESEPAHIYAAIRKKAIDESNITIRKVNPKEIPALLSDAKASVFFMNTYKQYSFLPIKFGESLSCGLPVIINAGIGDCDEIVLEEKAGVVINDFSSREYERATKELTALFSEEDKLRQRCRDVAKKYLSLEMGVARYRDIYKKLSC